MHDSTACAGVSLDSRAAVALAADPPAGPSAPLGRLLRPDEAPMGGWQRHAATLFRARMLDPDRAFPCIFGVDAVRRATLRFAFLPAGHAGVDALAAALRGFLAIAEQLGNRTSLVCFFEPDPSLETVEDYKGRFWALLQGLHDGDSENWPDGVDTDPDSPAWEFSFAGVPLFVVANTPAHRHRRSRYFEYLVVTFQPRFVFDDLGPDTRRGRNARRVIRRQLASYDEVPQTPYLGNFGDPDNREWMQYFLADDNTPLPATAKCPLHTTRPKPHDHPGERDMIGPRFDSRSRPALPRQLTDLLPLQGSFELQNDQPGKTHGWHWHNLDEELFVLDGDVTLFWHDGTARHEQSCSVGTWISLPAGTLHGSTAGDRGAVYVIRPKDGQTAVTTFLSPEEFPTP